MGDRTEEEYRLLAEESQEKFNTMRKELDAMSRRIKDVQKQLAICYTFFKSADDILDEVVGSSDEMLEQTWLRDIYVLLERGRYYSSEALEFQLKYDIPSEDLD